MAPDSDKQKIGIPDSGRRGEKWPIELRIEGMSCEHCVHAVDTALRTVQGVSDVRVSLDDGKARIRGNVRFPSLVRAVEDAGYSVSGNGGEQKTAVQHGSDETGKASREVVRERLQFDIEGMPIVCWPWKRHSAGFPVFRQSW